MKKNLLINRVYQILLVLFLTSCIQNPNRYVNRNPDSVNEGTKYQNEVKSNCTNSFNFTEIDKSKSRNAHNENKANKDIKSINRIERLEEPKFIQSNTDIYIQRTSFTLSYNINYCIPNWVAWELNANKLVEKESRTNDFLPDPQLDEDLAVTTDDYKDCGWDRGHMCPAGDNKWHWKAMQESFYMTNICPQHHNLNRGDWKELEEACRRWAMIEPVYIACGPILYKEPIYGYIGREHKIRIPDAFFKVILTGLETENPRAIGFIYKNTSGNNKLDSYVNSINQVERITGFDFFSELPDEIENSIESQYNLSDWK